MLREALRQRLGANHHGPDSQEQISHFVTFGLSFKASGVYIVVRDDDLDKIFCQYYANFSEAFTNFHDMGRDEVTKASQCKIPCSFMEYKVSFYE